MRRTGKSRSVITTIFLSILFVLLSLGSAAGARLYYHFYFAPTGVTLTATQYELNRAELVDMVLKAMVEANQQIAPVPGE